MARIQTYIVDTVLSDSDLILGSNADDSLDTVNFKLSDVKAYVLSGGSVTSVSGTGTVSGLTLTGTVTSSGSLTLGGTLALTSSDITTGLGYTPPTTNTTYDYGGVGAAGNINLALSGSDGSNDVVTMQAGTNITLTDNGSNTFTIDAATGGFTTIFNGDSSAFVNGLNTTGFVKFRDGNKINSSFDNTQGSQQITFAHEAISTPAASANTAIAPTGLSAGDGTFPAISSITIDDGHVTGYTTSTYTVPLMKEQLVQSLASSITLSAGGASDINFRAVTSPNNTDITQYSSWIHRRQLALNNYFVQVPSSTGSLIVRIALSAWVNVTSSGNKDLVIKLMKNTGGTTIAITEVQFDYARVGLHNSTFFSYIQFADNSTYFLEASSTSGDVVIQPQTELEWIVQI